MKAKAFKLLTFSVALGLAANALAQEKPEAVPRDTGSDLLWKKLETRVGEIADRLDGIIGVAILDLTDGRILEAYHYFEIRGETSEYGRILPPPGHHQVKIFGSACSCRVRY
jgi:hypothetical protein